MMKIICTEGRLPTIVGYMLECKINFSMWSCVVDNRNIITPTKYFISVIECSFPLIYVEGLLL